MGISVNKRIGSTYRKSEFIIQKKALALLYFAFLMIFLLLLVILAYAIVNPSGIMKAVVGAGSIMVLMALCIFFIIKGKLNYAVFTFTVPTSLIIVAARYFNSMSAPHTAFTTYLYYNFFVIIFIAVFGRKTHVTIASVFFIVCNILMYLVIRDRLDPLSLQAAGTGITTSTMALLMTGAMSLISVWISGHSTRRLREEADSNLRHYQTMETMFERIQGITNELGVAARSFSSTAAGLNETAQSQAAIIEQSSASIESMASAMGRVSSEATRQSEAINRVEGLISQLNGFIREVSGRAGAIQRESENALRQGRDAVDVAARTLEGMKGIHESAEKIKEITRLITDLADKTNLLSLNASIESARAGEAGKGFAVVAEEMSKLADNSTKSAKEISKLITETATNIDSGYEMFNEINRIIIDINGTLEQANRLSLEMNESSEKQLGLSGTAFEEVKGVNTLAFSISTSMQEQAANAAEISRSFDSINEITQNNAAASEEVSASTDSLNEHIGGLLAIVREGEGERGKNA